MGQGIPAAMPSNLGGKSGRRMKNSSTMTTTAPTVPPLRAGFRTKTPTSRYQFADQEAWTQPSGVSSKPKSNLDWPSGKQIPSINEQMKEHKQGLQHTLGDMPKRMGFPLPSKTGLGRLPGSAPATPGSIPRQTAKSQGEIASHLNPIGRRISPSGLGHLKFPDRPPPAPLGSPHPFETIRGFSKPGSISESPRFRGNAVNLKPQSLPGDTTEFRSKSRPSRYQPNPSSAPGGRIGPNLKTPGITPTSTQPAATNTIPKVGHKSRFQGFEDFGNDPAPDLPMPPSGQVVQGGKPAPVYRPHPPSNVGKTPENMPPSSVFRPHPPSNVGHAIEAKPEQRGPSKPGLPVSPKKIPGILTPGNTIRMPSRRDPFSHPSGRAPTAKDEPGGFI
jgi:hypothetical protein